MRDVIIIGGGPAGAVCATRLRAAGLDVVIVDKRTFPRDKVCAGWVTPAVVRTVGMEVDDYAATRVLQPITGFRVSRMGGPEKTLRYNETVSYGIRRCEFDDYLLQRSGATLRLGEPVRSLDYDGGVWRVNDDAELTAPLLIGAGGHFCPVARHLNTHGDNTPRRERVVAAQEIEFPLDALQEAACEVQPHEPQLFFCRDLAGYGWCFRKGRYLNVGLGREDNERLSAHVQAFVADLQERGRIPRDMPMRFHGHSYILYGHTRRRLTDDGVLLIGDAAGLAYPQSGEGIRTAIESAILAARVITQQAGGRYTRDRLQPYEAALRERFGEGDDPDGSPLPDWLKATAAGWLLRSNWFVRHVVVDRWFLHREVPALV